MQTVEATIDEHGTVRLREEVALAVPRRALVTILEEAPLPDQTLPPIIPAQTSTEDFLARWGARAGQTNSHTSGAMEAELREPAFRREDIYGDDGR